MIDIENEPVKNGSTFVFTVNFKIDDDLKDCIQEGDYFEFEISPENVKFTENTEIWFEQDGINIAKGTVTTDGKIKFVLKIFKIN